MFDVTIRLALNDDIKEIAEIESRIFDEKRSEKDFNRSIDDDNSMLLTAISNEKNVGYIYVYGQDIISLAVAEDYRRKGIANALINAAASKLSCELFLEVRESNNAAIKLYEKCGFEKISLRKRYYGDGENAILMRRSVDSR